MAHEKILIVEDETRVAQAICRALSLPGGGEHDVESCNSGEGALEKLLQVHYDLVITDLRMPGMSGLELLEQVRQISPGTRSILITAFGTSEVEAHAKLLANAYLPKPFSMKNLIQTVTQTLTLPPVNRRLIAFSEEGLRSIQARMESLCTDVSGLGAQLFDQSGQLLTATGQYGRFDATAFLALLGNTMSAANAISHLLDDNEAFDIHFHEGKNYETYAAQISEQVFLSLIMERHKGTGRIGMVWLYLRRAMAELRGLLQQAVVVGGAGLGTGLETAIDTALDEMFSSAESSEPATLGEPPLPKRRTAYDFSRPPVKRTESTNQSSGPMQTRHVDTLAERPVPDAQGTPAKPALSYEQARALGLINLDNLEAD